jgi:DNA-binding transcriptional LysR family regulator
MAISIAIGDSERVQFHQLEYFVAVAEEGSFTRGAQRARVVQSAASAAVARLEREFGVPLFVRAGPRITLTDAGRSLLAHARDILTGVRAARDELATLREGLAGTVTIGTLLSTGTLDLAAALRTFHARHPAVSIRMKHSFGHSGQHLEAVRTGSVDLALVVVPPKPPEHVRIDPLATLRLVLACAADHRLAHRRQVHYGDLTGETFIDFPQGWGNRVAVDETFRAAGLRRTVAIEVTDVASALELVAGGLGVTFVPQHVLDGRVDLAVVDLHRPLERFTLGLASALDHPLSAAAKALHRTVLDQGPNAAGGRPNPGPGGQ